LVLRDRHKAISFLGMLTSLMIGAAILATCFWGLGFWFSVVGGIRQPFDFDTGVNTILQVARQPTFVGLTIGAAVTLVHASIQRGFLATMRESPFALYLVCSWSVALLTTWKLGASCNYFFEPHLASVLWLSHWLRTDMERVAASHLLWLLICVAGVTGFEMVVSRPEDYTFVSSNLAESRKQRLEVLRQASKDIGTANPRFLSLVTHIDGYLVSDQVYLNDPYLYGLLWENELLSPESLATTIACGEFDLIAVPSSAWKDDPVKSFGVVLMKSVHSRYCLLEDSPVLGYALLIRCDHPEGASRSP
jgi:hypothetical protein